MSNKIDIKNFDASSIYEGGDLTQITAEELKGNLVAIRQLINNHNLSAKENHNKDRTISTLNSQIEYLKTSPFISIISAVINIIATIIITIAINLITSETKPITSNRVILGCGIVLILLASLLNILYPYVRGWFNKDKQNNLI